MAIDNKPYSRPYIKTLIEEFVKYRYSYSNTYRVSKTWHPKKHYASPELTTTILIRKDGITDINITIDLYD